MIRIKSKEVALLGKRIQTDTLWIRWNPEKWDDVVFGVGFVPGNLLKVSWTKASELPSESGECSINWNCWIDLDQWDQDLILHPRISLSVVDLPSLSYPGSMHRSWTCSFDWMSPDRRQLPFWEWFEIEVEGRKQKGRNGPSGMRCSRGWIDLDHLKEILNHGWNLDVLVEWDAQQISLWPSSTLVGDKEISSFPLKIKPCDRKHSFCWIRLEDLQILLDRVDLDQGSQIIEVSHLTVKDSIGTLQLGFPRLSLICPCFLGPRLA